MKTILFCFLITAAASVYSQTAVDQPGKPSDLKQIIKINVAAGTGAAKQAIVSEIRKSLPQLIFCDRAESAEVWLIFKSEQRTYFPIDSTSQLTAARVSAYSVETEVVATGEVLRPVSSQARNRVMRFEKHGAPGDERSLARQFADDFVAFYKRANKAP